MVPLILCFDLMLHKNERVEYWNPNNNIWKLVYSRRRNKICKYIHLNCLLRFRLYRHVHRPNFASQQLNVQPCERFLHTCDNTKCLTNRNKWGNTSKLLFPGEKKEMAEANENEKTP